MKCPQTLEVGVYVLGAQAPDEREAFEQHLATCPICQAEVADLDVLPGLLAKVDRATAEAIARADDPAGAEEVGSDDKVVSLLSAVDKRRNAAKRRWRAITAGVATVAAALALVVGLGVPRLFGAGEQAGPILTAMSKVVQQAPISAEVGVQPLDSGARVIMHCRYEGKNDPPWPYKLVVVPKSGSPDPVSTWTAGVGDEFEVNAVTTVPADQINRVEVQNASDGTVLLVLRR